MTKPGYPIVFDSTTLATDFSAEFWPAASRTIGQGISLPKARIIAAEGNLLTGVARPGLTHLDVMLRHEDSTGMAFGLYDNWLTVEGEDVNALDIPVNSRWEVFMRSQNYAPDITIRGAVFLEVEEED